MCLMSRNTNIFTSRMYAALLSNRTPHNNMAQQASTRIVHNFDASAYDCRFNDDIYWATTEIL
jgi:hypothetical protein